MKKWLICFAIWLVGTEAHGQLMQDATSQFKIYEDDDFFNVWGRGTDRAYTSGTSFGYRYMKRKRSTFVDNWLMPKAGVGAVNVWEWNGMQMMMTPNDLHDSAYIPTDFYYAAALFFRHELTSYNTVKKYSLHSEILMGFMGTLAFGKAAQSFAHNLLGDEAPNGWDNQLPNAPLLNYNFTYTRMMWNPDKHLEVIGAFSGQAGTFIDGVGAQTTIRAGWFNPWFGDPDIKKGAERIHQVYFFASPNFGFVFYNALLQGGLFRGQSQQFRDQSALQVTRMNPFVIGMDYGFGFTYRRCSFVYTQKTATAWMSGTGKHSVGNFTFLISLSKKPVPPPSTNR